MNAKSTLKAFYRRISTYNLFIPDENDYDEESNDPTMDVKHQRYTTRLYVLLLSVCMYILFYAIIMNTQPRIILITDIDTNKFENLYSEHGETLSCPCSTIKIPYQQFVSNTIQFHPVCTSFFVSQQWIEALYVSNRTMYSNADFPKTSSSQFQLLSSLCSLSQEIIVTNEANLNNYQFITVSLLSQSKVESEINATIELFKSSLSIRILSFLDYYQFITQTNAFVTAVGTNVILSHKLDESGTIDIFNSMSTYYGQVTDQGNDSLLGNFIYCTAAQIFSPALIYTINSTIKFKVSSTHWPNMIDYSQYNSIDGFFMGCTPFESILQATLDCLYEIQCIQLLNDYFPSLKEMNLNLSDVVLLANKSNHTVFDHLSNLFVDKWTIKVNYSAYLRSCNPSKCTYTTTNKIHYSYAITLFISLYGGLILILRSISLFLMKVLVKFKCQSMQQISIMCQQNVIQSIKQLNLFKKANQRTENDIKQQKLTTRIYLILLLIMITVLLLFNSLNTQIVTISVENPSLNTYIDLQTKYSHTLTCPCSTMTIPYRKFVSISPIFHQICSSDLIKDEWISTLKYCTTKYLDTDWRNRAFQQFHLLSQLCQLANKTVTTAVNEFLSQSFVVSNVLVESDFNTQLNQTLVQFYQSTTVYFHHLIDTTKLYIRIDQLFTVKFSGNENGLVFRPYSVQPIQRNTTENQTLMEVVLPLKTLQSSNLNSSKCYCFANATCQTSSVIVYIDFLSYTTEIDENHISYVIPGLNLGCSEFDSILFSTFECFYSDSGCFQTIRNYLQQIYVYFFNPLQPITSFFIPANATWFNAKPLIYNSTLTNFSRNTPISTIIKNLLVEQWNSTYSYNEFYQLCSPKYCTYQERIQTNNVIGIMTILISMIGGLIISLRLITLYLVKIIIKLISIIRRKQQQQQQQHNVQSWSERFKLIKRKMISTLYNIVINLNIFPRHTFRNDVDQMTAKYYGQLATRLYLILLIISFAILTIYTITQQHMITNEFSKPSFEKYNKLIESYGNQLKCSCSSISSPYREFIEIRPRFHEICSSIFVSDEIIDNLARNLSSNLLTYEKRDYRRWIISHIQYLQGLCQISIESIDSSIEQFHSTLFVSQDLLHESDFNTHIDHIIEQTKQNAPDSLNTIFLLTRNINFGNAIVSQFGTNFKYIVNFNEAGDHILHAESEIYDNDCLCSLYINCTSQAYFIDTNSLAKLPVKGLKIGCTQTESFLASTLECFSDSSCLNTIKQYTNYPYTLQSLSNQSQMNLTIDQLVQKLFIDQWLITKSYSSYYQQCLPKLCLYTYIQKTSVIYIASFLFGLQGGLTIVLQWICPRIIRFVVKIKINRNKRSSTVHPEHIGEIVPTINQLEVRRTISNRPRYFKMILSCFLILMFLVLLIISSMYIMQRINNQIIQATVSSINSTMTVNVTTISTSIASTPKRCPFQFETIPISMPNSFYMGVPIVAGDFNNDNLSDIAYMPFESTDKLNSDGTIETVSTLLVLLQNEDNTFEEPIISLLTFALLNFDIITTTDYNQDGLLDIVGVDYIIPSIRVFLGNGNGTFRELIFRLSDDVVAFSLSIGNLNNDQFLDFALLWFMSTLITVIFGNANGNLTSNTTYNQFTSTSILTSIAIGDMNGDGNGDIVVSNFLGSSINVLLGYGNGSFDTFKTSLIGALGLSIADINVGDFNEDMIQDVSFVYILTITKLGLMFGYNDGTFGVPIELNINVTSMPFQVGHSIVADFNNDGHLDFVTTIIDPSTMNINFGDGNGNFELYTALSSVNVNMNKYIAAVHFNNDSYLDIFFSSGFDVYILLNTGQCDNNNTQDIFERSTSIYN